MLRFSKKIHTSIEELKSYICSLKEEDIDFVELYSLHKFGKLADFWQENNAKYTVVAKTFLEFRKEFAAFVGVKSMNFTMKSLVQVTKISFPQNKRIKVHYVEYENKYYVDAFPLSYLDGTQIIEITGKVLVACNQKLPMRLVDGEFKYDNLYRENIDFNTSDTVFTCKYEVKNLLHDNKQLHIYIDQYLIGEISFPCKRVNLKIGDEVLCYQMMRIRRSESEFFYIGTHPIMCKNTNELKSCIQKKNENKSYLEQRYDHSKLYSIDTSLWVGIGLNPLKKMLALLPPHFRLPTEDEWEFAAKSGLNIDFATNDNTMGNDRSIICMNHNDKLLKQNKSLDEALKNLSPNKLGLYFMSGGIYEIVSLPNGSYGYKGGAFYEPLEHCRISPTKIDPEIPYCLRLVVSKEDFEKHNNH